MGRRNGRGRSWGREQLPGGRGSGSGSAARWRRAAEEAPEGGGCGQQVRATGPRCGVGPSPRRAGAGAVGGCGGGVRSPRGAGGSVRGVGGGGAPEAGGA